MRITADTNILVRIVVRDDIAQAQAALSLLARAEAVFITLPCLCEFVWVLNGTYRLPSDKVAQSVRAILERANVYADAAVVTAGLQLMDAGGDFADGVIAAAGSAMGSEAFVSFDRQAVKRLTAAGIPARHASEPA